MIEKPGGGTRNEARFDSSRSLVASSMVARSIPGSKPGFVLRGLIGGQIEAGYVVVVCIVVCWMWGR